MPDDKPRSRTRAETVDRSTLPEFMRSATIAAVVAEAWDHSVRRDEVYAGATGALVQNAADELRAFHGIPRPEKIENGRPDVLVGWDDGDKTVHMTG